MGCSHRHLGGTIDGRFEATYRLTDRERTYRPLQLDQTYTPPVIRAP